MAKITRVFQKIFGSTAGANEISTYGSLASGSPSYSTNPTTIQSLGQWTSGWFSAVLGAQSPCIEDMNALFYVAFYQLAYTLQTGVPEYDATTVYYVGSIAQDGTGNLYTALQNGFSGVSLTNTAYWVPIGRQTYVAIDPVSTPTYTLGAKDNGKIFLVLTANGATTFTLPAPASSANYTVSFKDKSGQANNYPITIARNASEQIEGVSASFIFDAQYGEMTLICDGTNWWITNG